jgi:hypothetical protein
MIVVFIYKCRRCEYSFAVPPEPGETEAGILLRQVTTHRCSGTTVHGHGCAGICDLIGYDETEEAESLPPT